MDDAAGLSVVVVCRDTLEVEVEVDVGIHGVGYKSC